MFIVQESQFKVDDWEESGEEAGTRGFSATDTRQPFTHWLNLNIQKVGFTFLLSCYVLTNVFNQG